MKLCAKCTLQSCCQTPCSVTAEHTNSSVVGQLLPKLVASRGPRRNSNHPGNWKETLKNSSVDWYWCEVQSTSNLFSTLF